MNDLKSNRSLSDIDANALSPGGDHYRAFVGPPAEYDLMGATQFSLLVTMGLREHHRVLDFGCGSLRAGRLLISYLARGNYHGLDPNQWLIQDAIANQIGQDMVRIKQPSFFSFDDFRADRCGNSFDFILAQSIFSHAGADLIETALAGFAAALSPDGLALATALVPGQDGVAEYHGDGWVYPMCVAHAPETFQRLASESNLHARLIPWFHPRQSWYALARNPARLPPPEYDRFIRGAILNEPAWARSLA